MVGSTSRLLCGCALLVVLLVSALSHVEGHGPLLAQLRNRALLDEDADKGTVLKDKTFTFLTKYEENFDISTFKNNPKAYGVWGWSEADKTIKYAVLASDDPSEALTAASGDEIKFIHLHVNGLRGQNSTDKLVLPKVSGAWTVKEEYKLYAAGSINDTMVANWTNTLGLKTAADLWAQVSNGNTYTNIHTNAHPDGEARGQNDWNYDDIEVVEDLISDAVRKNDSNWRLGFLTAYELPTPPKQGNKTSRAFVNFGWDGTKVVYGVLSGPRPTDGLFSATAYKDVTATLFLGADRGATGTMSLPLTVPSDATWQLKASLKVLAQGSIGDSANVTNANTTSATPRKAADVWAQIAGGKAYVVLSTPANPTGEVRGQVDWDYEGMELLKESVPAVDGKAGSSSGSKSWAPAALKPYLSFLLGAALVVMLLA